MKDGNSIHRRVLHYTHTGIDELYHDFHISKDGYTNAQVDESRQKYGSNLLTGQAKDTVLHRLRQSLYQSIYHYTVLFGGHFLCYRCTARF